MRYLLIISVMLAGLQSTAGQITNFVLSCSPSVGLVPACVAVADVNGDGRLDLITADFGANTLSVFFNVPSLTIRLADTNAAVIVWPAPSSGFVLQQNSDLTTTNWVNATNAVDFVGGQNQMVVSPPTGNDFFRLFHP